MNIQERVIKMSPKEEFKGCLEWEKEQKGLENIIKRNANTAPRETDVDMARSYEETLAKKKNIVSKSIRNTRLWETAFHPEDFALIYERSECSLKECGLDSAGQVSVLVQRIDFSLMSSVVLDHEGKAE